MKDVLYHEIYRHAAVWTQETTPFLKLFSLATNHNVGQIPIRDGQLVLTIHQSGMVN